MQENKQEVTDIVKIVKTYLNPCPAEPGYTLPFANSVDPDQLASKKPTDLDLHCLSLSIEIFINTLNQII